MPLPLQQKMADVLLFLVAFSYYSWIVESDHGQQREAYFTEIFVLCTLIRNANSAH